METFTSSASYNPLFSTNTVKSTVSFKLRVFCEAVISIDKSVDLTNMVLFAELSDSLISFSLDLTLTSLKSSPISLLIAVITSDASSPTEREPTSQRPSA